MSHFSAEPIDAVRKNFFKKPLVEVEFAGTQIPAFATARKLFL